MSCVTLILIGNKVVVCSADSWSRCHGLASPLTTVSMLLLSFESILFSMFTAIMFCTQASAICSDETVSIAERGEERRGEERRGEERRGEERRGEERRGEERRGFFLNHNYIVQFLSKHLNFLCQGIESLKHENATWEKSSWWISAKSVFGHPFSWKWFSPFHQPALSTGKPNAYSYTV